MFSSTSVFGNHTPPRKHNHQAALEAGAFSTSAEQTTKETQATTCKSEKTHA